MCIRDRPKGLPATLGVVYETHRGVVGFDQATSRRFLAMRTPTGFRSPQVDVHLRLDANGLRRFLVYATAAARPGPTATVLFIRSGQRAPVSYTHIDVYKRQPRVSRPKYPPRLACALA